MGWGFVVCDRNGVAIGEPEATGRTFNPAVSATETAGFQARTGSRLWSSIAAGDTTVKVYDSARTLRFWGDVISDEVTGTGQGGTVAVNASDLSFRLSQELVGKNVDGTGVQFTNVDSGQIIYTLLNTVNSEQATGITPGTKDTFVARTINYAFRKFSDVLSDLGSIQDSYEWSLRYTDGTPPIVQLDLKLQLGSDKSGSVFFEYGIGRNNCSGFTRVRSVQQRATRIYVLGQGGSLVSTAYDAGAETKGRAEDTLSYPDIADVAVIDALAATHVAVRRNPRVTVGVTPAPLIAPVYGVDYVKGDYVRLRAVLNNSVIVDGKARVWGATISIDEAGNETGTVTLEPQT